MSNVWAEVAEVAAVREPRQGARVYQVQAAAVEFLPTCISHPVTLGLARP